jgi:hypothetical protein
LPVLTPAGKSHNRRTQNTSSASATIVLKFKATATQVRYFCEQKNPTMASGGITGDGKIMLTVGRSRNLAFATVQQRAPHCA